MKKLVLNENIHEFAYKEKRSIKGIIKDWLYKETYEERIEELENELNRTNIRCSKFKTRCENLVKENKELEKRLKEYEME